MRAVGECKRGADLSEFWREVGKWDDNKVVDVCLQEPVFVMEAVFVRHKKYGGEVQLMLLVYSLLLLIFKAGSVITEAFCVSLDCVL